MAKRARPVFPGELEQMVLLAILQAGEEAYAVRVLRELDERAGRRVDRGALYTTLDRLEAKGWVTWSVESSTPERGGRRRRRFHATPAGVRVLRESRAALVNLWEGLGGLIAGESQ